MSGLTEEHEKALQLAIAYQLIIRGILMCKEHLPDDPKIRERFSVLKDTSEKFCTDMAEFHHNRFKNSLN